MQIYIKLILGLLFILSLVIFFNDKQFQVDSIYLSVVPIYIIMLLIFYIGRLTEKSQKLLELNSKYKDMELDFNTILDHSNDFFYMKDSQYKFRAVNDNFAKLTGHQHWSEIAGKTDFDVFPKEDAQKYRNDDENVIERGEQVLGRLESYPMDDGTKGWVKSSKIPIVDEDGKVIRMFGFSTDVTELIRIKENLEVKVEEETLLRRKVEEETLLRREKEKELIQQSKMASMGEMIGSIAHQWRQPLNELGIRIQALKYNYAREEIDEAFIEKFTEKNMKTINFMSKTIDDFRNFFKIDKEKQDFHIKDTIKEIIDIQSAQLKHHNIQIEIIGNDFMIHGYKTEFQQVILNLVSNSKDAFILSNTKRPKIDIILEDEKIIIEDNAGGIPEDIIDRVFEPYFTTKEQGQGTGMGLYMSKAIIEDNMDGKISATNKNEGARISIELKKDSK